MWAASHLPYNRNGFKFFTSTGGLGKSDIKEILERAVDIYKSSAAEGSLDGKASSSVKKIDYMTVYTSALVRAVRKAAGNIGNKSLLVYFDYAGNICGLILFSASWEMQYNHKLSLFNYKCHIGKILLSNCCLSFKLLEKPLDGFHIIVDAGNGAGGFFAVSSICRFMLLLTMK